MAAALFAGISAGVAYVGCLLCCKGLEYCKIEKANAHQQEDIYNVSSRVQHDNYQWPTHNARLSIDHLTILGQANKPIYDDAPPSYDEVMKTAVPSNGESSTVPEVVVEAPKPTTAAESTRPM